MDRVRRRAQLYGIIAAGGFSLLGNSVAGVALPWFVLTLTGSAALTGLAAAAGLVPLIIGAFFGGPIVDRFGSRRVAVSADLVSSAAVAAIPILALSGHLNIGILLGLISLGALLDGPGNTALDVRMPDLARLAGLPVERVTSIDELLENGAAILGPPLAGLSIAAFGVERTLFLTAGCSGLAAAINLVALPRHRPGRGGKVAPDILAGARFLIQDRLLRTLLWLFMAVIAIFGALNAVVMPLLFRAEGSGALGLGTFLASLAGGAVASALLFAVWGHRADGRLVLASGLFVAAAAIAAIAVAGTGPALFVAAAMIGLSTGALGPLVNAVFLRRAPRSIRGSVLGASTSAALGATPVAIVAAGLAADAVGARPVVVVFAATVLLCAGLASVAPALDQLRRASRGPSDAPDRRPQ